MTQDHSDAISMTGAAAPAGGLRTTAEVIDADQAAVPVESAPAPGPAGPLALPGRTLRAQVFLLALPMLGEQTFNFLIGLVDTLLAGTISKEATAAVGTAAYMSWFVSLGFALVGIGAAAVVSRSIGGHDPRTANRALNQALLLAVGLGALMSATAYNLAAPVAGGLMQEPTAERICRDFLHIDALGYIAACVTFTGMAVLRASGDTRSPMAIMIFVNILNAALSAGLVFGWYGRAWGVNGIVTGTLIARWLGCVTTLVVLGRGLHGLRLHAAALRPDPALMWRMLRVGLPAAADSSVMAVAQYLFIGIVAHAAAGPLSTATYAAHMIAMRVEAISYLPAFAWGTAAATLVGQYLGARQPAQARRAGHVAGLQGLCLVSLVGVGFYLLAGPIYAVMTSDPQVRAIGVPAFRLLAFAQPFLGLAIIYMNALRGAGDTRWPLLFSFIGGFLVRVPGAYLGGIVLGGGLIGAWCGMWADNVGRMLMATGRYVHGGWVRVKV